MLQPEIPYGPKDITPEWLTYALRSTGVLSAGCVTSIKSQAIGLGSSFTGEVLRLVPKYSQPNTYAPRSLIAKLPASEPNNRQAMNAGGAYEIEIKFYEELAPDLKIPIPRRYFSASNQDEAQHILLLEDLGSARVGDDLAGATLEEYQLAIDNLARFHATWWDNPRLPELTWIRNPGQNAELLQNNLRSRWEHCLRNLGDLIPESFLEVGEILRERFAEIRTHLSDQPITINHGDYRLDNMLFGTEQWPVPLTIIDWQQLELSRGTIDLAYFLVASMPVEKRRENENDLLRRYHSGIVENGVNGYPYGDFLRDFRLSLIRHVGMIVNAGTFYDFSDERGSAYISKILSRVGAALEEHQVSELIK